MKVSSRKFHGNPSCRATQIHADGRTNRETDKHDKSNGRLLRLSEHA